MTGLGLAIEGFWVSYNQGCTGRLAREKGFPTVKFGEGGGGRSGEPGPVDWERDRNRGSHFG